MASSMTGGVLVAINMVSALPGPVAIGGAVAFVVGLLLAVILGIREARLNGGSLGRAMASGMRTAWSWLWAFFP